MDFCNFFYRNLVGYEPDDISKIRKTEMTIQFLLDSKIPEEEIFGILMNSEISESRALLPENLPDSVWSGLIKRNKFYFHRSLQLTSPPPQFSIITGKTVVHPFYLEIRARFTYNDLLEYCYRKIGVPEELRSETKDLGLMKHLLNRYRNIDYVDPLDFVLALADHASMERTSSQLIELDSYESEVFKIVKAWKLEAHANQKDRIIWRYENV